MTDPFEIIRGLRLEARESRRDAAKNLQKADGLDQLADQLQEQFGGSVIDDGQANAEMGGEELGDDELRDR